MIGNKKLPVILLLLVVFGILIYFRFYQTEQGEILPPEEAIEQVQDDIIIDEPPVRIGQGQVLGIKDEKKEWLIEAETISIAEDRENTLFENIKKMVIFKEEEPHLTVFAEKGIANMQSKDIELNGNVVISNEDGDSLKGEKIFWHSETQKITSEEQVELQIDDHFIVAGGLSTNMEMTQLELMNRVTITMKL